MLEYLALRGYSFLWWALSPALLVYLSYRGVRQAAYRSHWGERFRLGAESLASATETRWIWVHAVSLGETQAASPLLSELSRRHPGHGILLSHGTPTGRRAGAAILERLGDQAPTERAAGDGSRSPTRQIYLPYDRIGLARDFLRSFRPVLGIIIETEVWPSLMYCAAALKIPMVLASGRLSARSLQKAQRFSLLLRPALASFSRILVQTGEDRGRVEQLIGTQHPGVAVVGNLKFDFELDPALLALGEALKKHLSSAEAGERLPVRSGLQWIVCASTRQGEEATLLGQWLSIGPGLRQGVGIVIVPRHPERFEEVAGLLDQHLGAGAWSRRSAWPSQAESATAVLSPVSTQEPGAAAGLPDLVLGDTMGEMAVWYTLSACVIMGGSIGNTGSQNLIEACHAGKPVVLGPSIYNFERAARMACDAGAAVQVPSQQVMLEALNIVRDRSRCAQMSGAARSFVQAHGGATLRIADAVDTLLGASPDKG